MENLSHSRQPNRGTSTFSKKIHSNGAGGGFKGTKNLCDEVYGGLPNFGVSSLAPRLEDYSEIFGSFNTSRASSIPVLDLPNVDETEVFFDARSSSLDYNEVFGGFNGIDFAVSYEDLVNRSEAGDCDSSDEAWTPAASDTLSEESDLSGKDHQFSNEGPYPSFDDIPEFSMSYHKVNQRSNEDMLNGIAHAVPGFTCLVDEMTTLQHKIAKKPSLELEETDDSNLTNGSGGGQPTDNDIGPHRCDRNNSCHRETVVSVSEINLRTRPCQVPPPSRPPPLTEVKKGHHNKFVSDYSTIAYEGTSGDSSPRFFDVEVDACSSAAASAAAIKEAMEKAKLKLRSAKEQMEKKKECFQSNSGSGSRKDIKAEGRVSKIVDRSGRMKVEGVNGICERQESVREEKEKFRKTAREVPEVLEGESTSSTAERNTMEKHENESWSAKDSCKVDGASQWEEESQFFELVTTDESMKDFEQTRNKKIPGQDAKVHGQNEKAAIIALEEQSENVGIVKAFREDHDLGELEKELKVRIEPCVFEESEVRSDPVRKTFEQKDHEKKTTLTAENCELGKHGKNFTMEKHCFETEKKMNVSDKLNKYDSRVEAKEKDSKFLVKQNLMGADKIVESGKKPKQSHQNVAHKERIKEGFEAAENEKRLKVLEEEENEKRSKALLEKAEKEKRLKEALEQQGNERRLQLASEQQGNGRMQQLASEQQGNGRTLQLASEQQGNGRTLQLASEQLENEKRLEARQHKKSEHKKSEKKLKETSQIEEHEKQLNVAPEQESFDRRHKEGCKRELDNKFKFSYENTEVRVSVMACESESDRKRSVEAHQKDKRKTEHEALEQVETYNFPKEVSEWEETAKMFKQDIDLEERQELNKGYCSMQKDEINGEIKSTKGNNMHMKEEVQLAKEKLMHVEEEVKSTEGNHIHLEKEVKSVKQNQLHMEEEDLCACDEPCELDFINFGPSQSRNHDESSREIKASDVANGHEANGEMRAEYRTNEKQPRAVEIENVSVCESSKASERDEEDLEHEKCQSRKKEAKESLPLDDSVKKVSGGIEREDSENGKTKCRIQSSDVSLPSNNHMKETGEAGAFVEQPNEEKTKSCPQVESLPEIQLKGSTIQRKEGGEDVKNAQLASIQKHNREKVLPAQTMKECVEDIRKTEASRLAASEGKQKSQKSGEEATQTTERRGINIGEPFVPQERETERMKGEKELENERLRKIEEEREREREREKDRMAVDLATVEARERAYAEARDRAERAALERMTTEARQRAMAEARERLERAGAEVREKSSAGKAAMEAKLRAERAAVERAMAEAREHAAEKAKAEARERMQRSVSDKFYTYSRNNGMTQSTSSSDLQGTQFHSKGSLRYSYSSSYGERYEGVEGESAQRCKARLERQCRTTERAAKALAEKNMRDLIAQREQAERNRVAVTLDADVRRWSSGKEGNLRALLSTLQYILGPDSGWQPVPLTEVITAAAVKKAYRKATLCVHPDKLQQRGASIQQKYISEKVFDLLKEAWNKFNSEER